MAGRFGDNTHKRPVMSKLFFAICAVFFVISTQAVAGSGHQETSVFLPVNEARVCQWIESHADQLTEATGAEIVRKKDDRAHLIVRDDDGRTFDFVVTRVRTAAGNAFDEELTKVVSGQLTAQATHIGVSAVKNGCIVHIRMSAEVEGVAGPKLAVGLRRKVRAIRAMIESAFGGAAVSPRP
jgi:limonene-1,2-epoxide hydrolase